MNRMLELIFCLSMGSSGGIVVGILDAASLVLNKVFERNCNRDGMNAAASFRRTSETNSVWWNGVIVQAFVETKLSRV